MALTGCGRSGDNGGGGGGGGGDEGDPEPDPVPTPGASLRTNVGVDPVSYQMPDLPACARLLKRTEVPRLSSPMQVDGRMDEWTGLAALFDDPALDGDPRADITKVWSGFSGESMGIFLALRPQIPVHVNFEFGGLNVTSDRLVAEVRQRLRLQPDGTIEEFIGSKWQAVGASDAVSSSTAGGIELLLSKRALGDAIMWPGWWVRIFLSDPADGTMLDSTGAVYQPSVLATSASPFVFSGCAGWNSRQSSVVVQHLSENLAGNESHTEMAFQLIRSGIDTGLAPFTRKSLPVNSTAVVATRFGQPVFRDLAGYRDPEPGLSTLYRAVFVNTEFLGMRTQEWYPQGRTMSQVLERVIALHLAGSQAADVRNVALGLASGLRHGVLRAFIGDSWWLDTHRPDVRSFTEDPDTLKPRSVESLLEGARYWPDLSYSDRTTAWAAAKLNSAGRLLAYHAPLQVMTGAVDLLETGGPMVAGSPYEQLLQAILSVDQDENRKKRLSRLWGGWFVQGSYHKDYLPAMLLDPDMDGLPDFIEMLVGSARDNRDTDGDGWSDYAEVVRGFSPLTNSIAPDSIMADGEFGDWQNLMPQRLGSDLGGAEEACPKSLDIELFAAIAARDDIVIAAKAAGFDGNDSRMRWEAAIDFTGPGQQVLISARGGRFSYDIKDPVTGSVLKTVDRAVPVARETIEWSVNRHAIGHKSYFNLEIPIKIRLRTVYTKGKEEIFCDETGWFAPYISE